MLNDDERKMSIAATSNMLNVNSLSSGEGLADVVAIDICHYALFNVYGIHFSTFLSATGIADVIY